MKNTDKRAANQMYIQKVLIGKRTIIGHDQKINIIEFMFSLNYELPCTTQANLCGEENNNIQRNTIL